MCSSKATNRGFTLVEMMVSITIGLFIGLVVLEAQAQLFKQSAYLNDLTVRQNEVRTGLDLLTRDVASAGFGQSWGVTQCDITLSYANGQAQAFPAISSVSASSATTVPLTSRALGYPSAASAIPTEMVLINESTAIPQQNLGQSFRVTQFGTTQSSSGQGAANSTQLPLPLAAQGDTSLQVNNEVQVRVQIGALHVCYLVPVSKLTTNAKAMYLYSKGVGMPSNGYSGFDPTLASLGVSSGVTDTELLNANVTDLGAPSNVDVLTVYYVGLVDQIPALWRVHVNEQSGAVIDAQPVALGVVSLQTRYVVGGTAETWAQVVAAGQQDQVQAVQFALVSRTLHPDYGYTAPSQITVSGYSNYPVPASDTHYHYSVVSSQITLRNLVWNTVS